MIIALDCDGVITDCATAVHEAASHILRSQLPAPEYWHSYDFTEAMLLSEDDSAYLFEQLRQRAYMPWCIRLYPGAREFVGQLRAQGHDVYFLTSPWQGLDSWVPARDTLLQTAFPGVDIVYAKNKNRGAYDLLIDDSPDNVAKALGASRAGGTAVLFNRPWNKLAPAYLMRADGYAGVLELTAD